VLLQTLAVSPVNLEVRKTVAGAVAAQLESAKLESAKLRSVELRSAELRSAELRSAELKSARLKWQAISSAVSSPGAAHLSLVFYVFVSGSHPKAAAGLAGARPGNPSSTSRRPSRSTRAIHLGEEFP
jgi:Pentapeptide repeats (8 copies)